MRTLPRQIAIERFEEIWERATELFGSTVCKALREGSTERDNVCKQQRSGSPDPLQEP